ncbi:TPA: DnaD domain protein [Streptococcus suis]|nr:DnaD domain protein [Streptococcus suis]
MATKPQPNGNQMATKCPHRLGKDSIDKDSIGEQQLGAGAGKNIIFEKLKDAFGEMSINGTIVGEVEDLLSKHGQELLIHALDETILNSGRSIRYTRSILERWHGQGLKTVEQVKQSNTGKQKSNDWVPDPNYPPPY